ncbi:MAG: hypothetical protein ACE5OO_07025, partial [Candidatus Bathyarchaeia archaeon]
AQLSKGPDPTLRSELEGLGEVEREGRVIKITAENYMEALGELLQIATRRDVGVEYLTISRPSLEDAFVRLTGVSPEVMRAEKERGR